MTFDPTAGMLIADAIGFGIGIVMGKKIPERAVKWIAGLAAVSLAVYWLGRGDIRGLTGQEPKVD